MNRSFPSLVCVAVWRYQPEVPSAAYEMANTQDENEMGESYNEGNIDMLPQPEDRFTIRNLLIPSNTEPSPLSGFAVNICTSVLGESHKHTHTLSRRNSIEDLPGWPLFTVLLSSRRRCFGVRLLYCRCSRGMGALVTVRPLCYLGGLSDSHLHRVETAAEQGQARLQGSVCSFSTRFSQPPVQYDIRVWQVCLHISFVHLKV